MCFKKSQVELLELHSQNAGKERVKTCYVPEASSYTQITTLIHAQITFIFKSLHSMIEFTELV